MAQTSSHEIYIALRDRQGLICNICGRSLKREFEQYMFWYNTKFFPDGIHHRYQINLSIDHIIPKSKGGGPKHIKNIKNLALTHKTCNIEKGDSLLVAGLNQKNMDSQNSTQTTNPTAGGFDAIGVCNDLRKEIKATAEKVKSLTRVIKNMVTPPADSGVDQGEMIANTMLAYRHLEDASMRLGKVIQASNGGASVYDKESTVGA